MVSAPEKRTASENSLLSNVAFEDELYCYLQVREKSIGFEHLRSNPPATCL